MQNHQFYGADYPKPGGILEGPWWLLTPEQKDFTKNQKDNVNEFVCDEEQKPMREFYLNPQYTGLECLPPDELQALKKKMEDNKTWEEENGPLMFDSPKYPQQLVDYREPRPVPIPLHTVAPMSPAAKAWIVEWKRNVSEQRHVRNRQILKWVQENKFPTRKNHLFARKVGIIPAVIRRLLLTRKVALISAVFKRLLQPRVPSSVPMEVVEDSQEDEEV
jgi:hypothetical protein